MVGCDSLEQAKTKQQRTMRKVDFMGAEEQLLFHAAKLRGILLLLVCDDF
jgi:hypothetical protein